MNKNLFPFLVGVGLVVAAIAVLVFGVAPLTPQAVIPTLTPMASSEGCTVYKYLDAIQDRGLYFMRCETGQVSSAGN